MVNVLVMNGLGLVVEESVRKWKVWEKFPVVKIGTEVGDGCVGDKWR